MTRIISLAIACSFALAFAPMPAQAADPQQPPAEAEPADPDGDADVDAGEPAPDPAADPQPQAPARQVGEVLATSTRGERDNLLVPGNTTVIDRAKIESSGARDLPDLLRREAGLSVTNTTGNPEGYTIEARGFNNGGGNGSRTLVLIDGRRVNEPRSDSPDWSLIPLDRVERVEIVRGPASAAWGDNAMGGVIHIQTRSGEGAPRFEARGGLGSYGNWQGSLFGGGSAGPVTASISAHDTKDGGYRDRSLFRSHGGEVKLGFDLGEIAHFGVRSGYSSDERNRPGTLDEMQKRDDRRQAEPVNFGLPGPAENFQVTRQRFVDGTFELALAEDVTLTSVAWYQMRRDNGFLANLTQVFAEQADSWAIGVNTQVEVDKPVLGHENQLVVGGDWLRERFRPQSAGAFIFGPDVFLSFGDKRTKRHLYGFFFQDDFSITDSLIFSAGVRYDRNHREGTDLIIDPFFPKQNDFKTRNSEWSPRGALTWRPCEPLALYASYSEGFRFPNLDEAFGAFGFSPLLMPETSRSYEIGAKVRTERTSLNLALYEMKVTNEIFLDIQAPGTFPFGQNVNLGRVQHRGVEVQGDARPWDWLELYASYTYEDVKIEHDPLSKLEGKRMPIVPHHRGTGGALVFLPCDVEVGTNVNWVGSRFVINDVANDFNTLSSHTTWDAHLAWRPRIGKHLRLHLMGLVYNILDRKYSDMAGLRFNFDPSIPPFGDYVGQRRFYPSEERSWEARVAIEIQR